MHVRFWSCWLSHVSTSFQQ